MADNEQQHEEQVVSDDIFDQVAVELGEDPGELAAAEPEDPETSSGQTSGQKPDKKKSKKKTKAQGSQGADEEVGEPETEAEAVADEVTETETDEESDPTLSDTKPKKVEKAKKKGSPTPPNPAKAKRKKYDKTEAAKVHGKRYAAAAAKVEADKRYELAEAAAVIKETATTKFDSSVEIHMRLGIDPKYQDQQLRATVVLPHGTGKSPRVAVIAGLDKQQEARKAGADQVGEDDLIKKIESGTLDFDVLVATPEAMGKIGRLGKILGTKGLMPNPKSGTVTPDVGKAVTEIKAGRVEFRVDKDGNLHQAVGKSSLTPAQLEENLKTFLQAVMQNKPAGAKGTYVKAIYLTTTMGPSVTLETGKTLANLSA